ncbi:MAG: DNA polymerase IV, partial [Pseudonocardiales bacterium]
FAHDVVDRAVLRRELLRLVERCTAALRGRDRRGRRIALKIRYPDFTTVSRSRTLADPTDSAHRVFAVATELLDGNLPRGTAVRLLGVRVELLVCGVVGEQLTLDGDGAHWPDVERAADAARSRFGGAAVRLATLLEAPGRSGCGETQSPKSGNQIG